MARLVTTGQRRAVGLRTTVRPAVRTESSARALRTLTRWRYRAAQVLPRRLTEELVITAFVMIEAEAGCIPEAAQAIADIDGVTEVYSCAGDVDLIAVLRVAQHEDLATLIPGRIGKIDGVLSTDTHIAFRSYSRQDTEVAFAIGDEDAD
jgi:DNA-binding Lrp family transcriptional regulator